MSVIDQSQKKYTESQSLLYFSSSLERDNNIVKIKKTHILYSRGNFLEGVNYLKSLQKIANLLDRSPQEVEEFLLSGRPKKVFSTPSLKKILSYELQLKELGLDVYIQSRVIN